jgi:hypothetical protein
MFVAFVHRFVYKYCIENGHKLERASVSLSVIGSAIQEIGFPRQFGKLRRLLERRSDLFQVFDRQHQGVSVYAHVTPRRLVTNRSQPLQPLRPQPPNPGLVTSISPSDSNVRSTITCCRFVQCTCSSNASVFQATFWWICSRCTHPSLIWRIAVNITWCFCQ